MKTVRAFAFTDKYGNGDLMPQYNGAPLLFPTRESAMMCSAGPIYKKMIEVEIRKIKPIRKKRVSK